MIVKKNELKIRNQSNRPTHRNNWCKIKCSVKETDPAIYREETILTLTIFQTATHVKCISKKFEFKIITYNIFV